MYSKLYSQNKEILHNTFFQYIVSGLIGVSGQNVPSLVEEDHKKKVEEVEELEEDHKE